MSEKKDKQLIDHDVVRDGIGRIQGVFSSQSRIKAGSGATQVRGTRKIYWSAFELDDGRIEIQPLNRHYIPAGPKDIVNHDEFLVKFSPEPEFYMSTVYPAMQENESEMRGERNRESDMPFNTQFKPGTASKVDEGNVRANFGLGLTYLDRGDQNKARDIFSRIVELDAAFEEEHKHLFNDFGINMRKNKMFDEALKYYLRAAELVTDDEHLFHNIARCYYEMGDVQGCKEYLRKSLAVNPRLRESQLFWDYLKKKGHLEADGAPF